MIPFVLFGQKKSLEITKQEHIWLEKHKNKFVFTTECMYPPYIFTDKQGKLAGLIVDYLDEIQHITDINFEIVPCENFSNIKTDIDEKSIDFFSSFSIDSSYNSKYKITKNYFSFPAIVLKTYNKNKKDLNNSKVLIESDLRLLRFLKQQYPNSLIQTINSESDGLKQISMEYADYCVLDFAQYSYFEKQMKTNNFVIEKTLNYNYNLSFVCNNDTLAKILDKAIDAISEKTKNSITKKWINSNKIFDFGIIFYIVLIIIILVLSLLLIFNVVKIKNIKIFHNKFLDNTKTINTTNLEFKDKDDKSNYSVESNKNISLSYLHNLSHEIRTPLNVIVGFSEIISMNSENKHEKHVEIKLILND